MGLSMSDAVKTPNAETRKAMSEADEILRIGQVRFKNADDMLHELEKNLGE
jgi:antitoxin component of RelBE/YafQ-DinJ toxin-antitoxin module